MEVMSEMVTFLVFYQKIKTSYTDVKLEINSFYTLFIKKLYKKITVIFAIYYVNYKEIVIFLRNII